jgi:hypothetical protein
VHGARRRLALGLGSMRLAPAQQHFFSRRYQITFRDAISLWNMPHDASVRISLPCIRHQAAMSYEEEVYDVQLRASSLRRLS